MSEYGETIAVRFPPELQSQLERFAKRQLTSASSIIRVAVKEYLDEREPQGQDDKPKKANR